MTKIQRPEKKTVIASIFVIAWLFKDIFIYVGFGDNDDYVFLCTYGT